MLLISKLRRIIVVLCIFQWNWGQKRPNFGLLHPWASSICHVISQMCLKVLDFLFGLGMISCKIFSHNDDVLLSKCVEIVGYQQRLNRSLQLRWMRGMTDLKLKLHNNKNNRPTLIFCFKKVFKVLYIYSHICNRHDLDTIEVEFRKIYFQFLCTITTYG